MDLGGNINHWVQTYLFHWVQNLFHWVQMYPFFWPLSPMGIGFVPGAPYIYPSPFFWPLSPMGIGFVPGALKCSTHSNYVQCISCWLCCWTLVLMLLVCVCLWSSCNGCVPLKLQWPSQILATKCVAKSDLLICKMQLMLQTMSCSFALYNY